MQESEPSWFTWVGEGEHQQSHTPLTCTPPLSKRDSTKIQWMLGD